MYYSRISIALCNLKCVVPDSPTKRHDFNVDDTLPISSEKQSLHAPSIRWRLNSLPGCKATHYRDSLLSVTRTRLTLVCRPVFLCTEIYTEPAPRYCNLNRNLMVFSRSRIQPNCGDPAERTTRDDGVVVLEILMLCFQ